jgi:hypothetical protein
MEPIDAIDGSARKRGTGSARVRVDIMVQT